MFPILPIAIDREIKFWEKRKVSQLTGVPLVVPTGYATAIGCKRLSLFQGFSLFCFAPLVPFQ